MCFRCVSYVYHETSRICILLWQSSLMSEFTLFSGMVTMAYLDFSVSLCLSYLPHFFNASFSSSLTFLELIDFFFFLDPYVADCSFQWWLWQYSCLTGFIQRDLATPHQVVEMASLVLANSPAPWPLGLTETSRSDRGGAGYALDLAWQLLCPASSYAHSWGTPSWNPAARSREAQATW